MCKRQRERADGHVSTIRTTVSTTYQYHKEIKIKEIKSNIKDAYANRKIMDYIKKY